MKYISQELSNLLGIFFPRLCMLCNNSLFNEEDYICFSCKVDLPTFDDNIYPNEISKKFWGIIAINSSTSLLIYNKVNSTQTILKKIKYNHNQNLAQTLGRDLGKKIKSHFPNLTVDYLIPVPLHSEKLKSRGFNQSESIANGINEILNWKIEKKLVIRNRNTKTQTRLDRATRWENVNEVFTLLDKERIRSKSIALVDDVLTTGATLGNLAMLLKSNNAKEIHIFTLAIAL